MQRDTLSDSMFIISHHIFNRLLYQHSKQGTIPEFAQFLAARYTDKLSRKTGLEKRVGRDGLLRIVTYLLGEMDIGYKRIDQTGWSKMSIEVLWRNKDLEENDENVRMKPQGHLFSNQFGDRIDHFDKKKEALIETGMLVKEDSSKIIDHIECSRGSNRIACEPEKSVVIPPYYPVLALKPPSTLDTPVFGFFISHLLIHITHFVGWRCYCKVIEDKELIVVMCTDLNGN